MISGRGPLLVGLVLLLCALAFYYFAVLKIDYHKTLLLNLRPSDAAEYFAQAKALSKDGWPSIQIGYDKLPCTTPIGYPAAMLPWLKVLPAADSVLAPFRTNQTLGLLLLLAVFGFYAYLAMPLSGGFAVLLLATLPGFSTFCRSSMSEISASALFILAFMFAYLGMSEQRRWKIYLAGALLGLSLNVRLQSLFFAPLLLVMTLFPARQTRLRWLIHCVALLIVFTLAAGPVLVLNTIQFHSPLKTGYSFWQPLWVEERGLFSLQHIPKNIVMLWREFAQQPQLFTIANSFGTGTVFVPAFILLICVGFFFIRLSRFVICAFLGGLSFFAAAVCFRFPDGRYFLPLLLLLIAVAVLPVTWAAKNLVVEKRGIAALAIFVFFAAACLGYPSRSGYNTVKIDRFQAWDALHFVDRPRQPTEFIAQRHLVEVFGRQPGIVLSDINPVYLNALLPEPFVAAPIDQWHKYTYSHIWHYKRAEALALVKRGRDQSVPVYALFVSPKEMQEKSSRLPKLPGYEWETAESHKEAGVLQLVSVAAER
ncbi:MAG: hypothetical protein ABR514_03190 [Chthoniobacterales bacterium]